MRSFLWGIIVATIIAILIGWQWCCRKCRRRRRAVVGVATVGPLRRNRSVAISDTEIMSIDDLIRYMIYHGDAESWEEAERIIQEALEFGSLKRVGDERDCA